MLVKIRILGAIELMPGLEPETYNTNVWVNVWNNVFVEYFDASVKFINAKISNYSLFERTFVK